MGCGCPNICQVGMGEPEGPRSSPTSPRHGASLTPAWDLCSSHLGGWVPPPTPGSQAEAASSQHPPCGCDTPPLPRAWRLRWPPGTAPGFGEKKGLSLNSAGDSSCPPSPTLHLPSPLGQLHHRPLPPAGAAVGNPSLARPRGTLGGRAGPSQPMQLQLWPRHSGLPYTLPG